MRIYKNEDVLNYWTCNNCGNTFYEEGDYDKDTCPVCGDLDCSFDELEWGEIKLLVLPANPMDKLELYRKTGFSPSEAGKLKEKYARLVEINEALKALRTASGSGSKCSSICEKCEHACQGHDECVSNNYKDFKASHGSQEEELSEYQATELTPDEIIMLDTENRRLTRMNEALEEKALAEKNAYPSMCGRCAKSCHGYDECVNNDYVNFEKKS